MILMNKLLKYLSAFLYISGLELLFIIFEPYNKGILVNYYICSDVNNISNIFVNVVYYVLYSLCIVLLFKSLNLKETRINNKQRCIKISKIIFGILILRLFLDAIKILIYKNIELTVFYLLLNQIIEIVFICISYIFIFNIYFKKLEISKLTKSKTNLTLFIFFIVAFIILGIKGHFDLIDYNGLFSRYNGETLNLLKNSILHKLIINNFIVYSLFSLLIYFSILKAYENKNDIENRSGFRIVVTLISRVACIIISMFLIFLTKYFIVPNNMCQMYYNYYSCYEDYIKGEYYFEEYKGSACRNINRNGDTYICLHKNKLIIKYGKQEVHELNSILINKYESGVLDNNISYCVIYTFNDKVIIYHKNKNDYIFYNKDIKELNGKNNTVNQILKKQPHC